MERLFSRDPADIAEVTFTRDGERRTLRDPAAIAAYSRALGASRPFSRGRSRPCAPWQVEVRDRAGGVARFELGRSPSSPRDAWLEVRGRAYRNGALVPRLDALGLPLLQGDCRR